MANYPLTSATVMVIIIGLTLSIQSKYWSAESNVCYVGIPRPSGYGYGSYRNVAVASEGMLEFMTYNGHVTTVVSREFKDLMAVAYDPAGDHMYLSDAAHENGSIFQLRLDNSELTPLVPKQRPSVQGIAFDPVTTSLYWTNGHGKTISKLSFAESKTSVPMTLHKFDKELPMGIAVDNCRRFLYWTNSNHQQPSIERSGLDGSNREVIVKDDLFQPMGIVVDQPTVRLYWSDDREGIHYKIESSDLDGSARRTVHKGTHHQPFSLTVGPDYIFWSDWIYNAVWSLPKRGGNHSEPTMIKLYHGETPMGLVAHVSTVCLHDAPAEEEPGTSAGYVLEESTTVSVATFDSAFCLNNGTSREDGTECTCPAGYSGDRCEIPACFAYCMHGSCYLDSAGFPQCRCQPGYDGDRCHVDICENYCLNGGRCTLGKGGKPLCACSDQHGGQRCERSVNPFPTTYTRYETADNVTVSSMLAVHNESAHQTCASRQLDDFVLIGLSSVIVVQIVIMFLLVRKVFVLRKRPRIKKRIIVNKNVTPLTSRPPQQGEQCEITIENCCNMNICETPCFEPQLRTSKTPSKTEEKTNLLGSMEEPQSCSPCHEDLY